MKSHATPRFITVNIMNSASSALNRLRLPRPRLHVFSTARKIFYVKHQFQALLKFVIFLNSFSLDSIKKRIKNMFIGIPFHHPNCHPLVPSQSFQVPRHVPLWSLRELGKLIGRATLGLTL